MHRLLVTLALVAGCRADPGAPDYSSHADLRRPTIDAGVDLRGPKPFVEGEERLALGLFYEGGASERVLIDGVGVHYYIFTLEGSGRLTYTQETSSDRVEGALSDRLVLEGTPWWGGGLIYDTPRDLSRWRVLAVSLRSSSPSLAALALRFQSGTPAREVSLDAREHGWAADGEWHSLRIPIAALEALGFDSRAVRAPFILGGTGGDSGESLLVDDLYLELE
jgi:hypothetical protein